MDHREGSKPPWLKIPWPTHPDFFRVADRLKRGGLHTICQSARCPNRSGCWSERTATFLILGDVCTRTCSFCAVAKGMPGEVETGEPERVAEAASAFGLTYVVLTSVTRDDLPDGGSSVFVRTVEALRRKIPGVKVEVLIPDFQGRLVDLETVAGCRPDVINHNLEVPESLYPSIGRSRAQYRRSLEVLERARALGAVTKSGLMLGLGESAPDILQAFSDLGRVSCDLLTLGQYLRPTRSHPPVRRYYSPEEFSRWRVIALDFGFRGVEAGPLVRSSYRARSLSEGLRETAGA